MPEQMCRVSDEIELCYETFGDPLKPTALLIMGLATQMIGWPEEFCEELAARGFHVVRFDNRDVGRSTHVKGRPPTPLELLTRSKKPARYRLSDMADDASGLLRELDLGPAHVIGASMGGMIAQTLAARHPDVGAVAHVDHVDHRQPLEGPAGAAASTRCSCAGRRRGASSRSSGS